MLSVDERTEAKDVDAAYFEAVKKWHPDRLPPGLQAIKPKAQQIFKHLTDARDTLTDGKKRVQYRETVQDGGGTPAHERRMATLVNAAVEYQKVEVLVRRHAWRDALALVEGLVEVAPEEADYHAMLAWVLFQIHGASTAEMVVRMHAEVDAALKADPNHERALYLKGLLAKTAGRDQDALTYFKRIVDANPNHTDALREVRLAEMRRSKGPTGILGKFLGRKP